NQLHLVDVHTSPCIVAPKLFQLLQLAQNLVPFTSISIELRARVCELIGDECCSRFQHDVQSGVRLRHKSARFGSYSGFIHRLLGGGDKSGERSQLEYQRYRDENNALMQKLHARAVRCTAACAGASTELECGRASHAGRTAW